jgi:TPR repeat protein
MPFGGAKIAGRFDNSGAEPINLGTTDSNGTLDINLAELSPPVPSGDIGGEPYGSSVTILVNGKQAGTASISAAYAAWRLGWETQKRQAHAAEAQRAEERAESERQGIERQKEREKQTAECNAGNGASCYSSHNYRRACDLGVQRACRIVNAPSEPAKPQATPEDAEVARVRENCTKGDQGACAAMSYANSCNDGSSDGCQALAIAYLRGGIGVARNTEHATGFFTLACRIDPGKCIAYGLEFYRGVSGFPRSVETGERFFDLACAGDAQQCAVLGSMYRTGNGVRRDPEKGMKYLERGCAANSPECCRLKGER